MATATAKTKKATQKTTAAAETQAGLPGIPGLDFEGDIGGGMEGTDKDSFAIPFLRALQKISPQCEETDPEFIADAKGGMLFNTATRQLWDGKSGLVFIAVAYQRRFLHWGARGSDSSGFKGEYLPEEAAEMERDGKVILHEGRLLFPLEDGTLNAKKCDSLQDTRSHFGLIVDEKTGDASQALLALTSTQTKKSKQLMTMLNNVKVKRKDGRMVTPPTWASKFRVTTVLESNDQGSWYGVRFEPEGFITSQEVYDAGKAFHDTISSGEAKVNYAEAEGGTRQDSADAKEKF